MVYGERESRRSGGLPLPFGVAGVAAIGALALALVALLVPREWLESLAFQLYLDRVFADAVPPFGLTARLVSALGLGLVGALGGWALARLFGVTATPGSLDGLLDRLRGTRADDEEDAPWLRAADRHPDAPARRPLSAARDIPSPPDDADLAYQRIDASMADELVLDTQYWEADKGAPLPAMELSTVEPVAVEPEPLDLTEMMEQADTADWPEPAAPMAAYDFRDDEPVIDAPAADPEEEPVFDLAPPMLADWESAPEPAEELTQEPAPDCAAEPAPEPLDLSVARLDQLLARLEAGLARREGLAVRNAATAKATASATAPIIAHHGAPEIDDLTTAIDAEAPAESSTEAFAPDPAFPQDPALAAALATLRRLNQQAS